MWKDIKGYEWEYQLNTSNFNEIRSIKFWNTKILKSFLNKYWHISVNLFKWWIGKHITISRIVWITYLWLHINTTETHCLHKDETLDSEWRLNNNPDNLFLGTHKDNMRDRDNKWRSPMKGRLWKDSPFSKKVNQYSLEWEFIKTWNSMIDIKKELWIRNCSIWRVANWQRNFAGWFIWKFV